MLVLKLYKYQTITKFTVAQCAIITYILYILLKQQSFKNNIYIKIFYYSYIIKRKITALFIKYYKDFFNNLNSSFKYRVRRSVSRDRLVLGYTLVV